MVAMDLVSVHNACITDNRTGITGALHKTEWLTLHLEGSQYSTHRQTDLTDRLLWVRMMPWAALLQSGRAFHFQSNPTVLLTAPANNPSHQYWDVLVNLFQLFHARTVPFTHWIAPSLPSTCWMCSFLDVLWKTLDVQVEEIAARFSTNTTHAICFHQLWIPRFSKLRAESHATVPNAKEVNTRLRSRLTEKFSDPSHTTLIYSHQDSIHRQWKNAEAEAARLSAEGVAVWYIRNMSALTFEEQCRAFWDADNIIFPHGGHEGNLLCARAGTRVVEMACASAKNVGFFAGPRVTFHRIMGLRYRFAEVPQSNCIDPITQSHRRAGHGHYRSFTTATGWMNSIGFSGCHKGQVQSHGASNCLLTSKA